MDQETFEKENHQRIKRIEQKFGRAGTPLEIPGRVLVGEGRLIKQSRKKRIPKDFFLFSDILVYGSCIMKGRWYNNQKIIALEDIVLEDMDDSTAAQHQWLIRTPRKSFFVSAFSLDEKQAWMEKIRECRSNLLQDGSHQPSGNFAVTWIPDQAALKCMRCLETKFTATNRRHHCRKCGFVVCNSCSKQRKLILHIHPKEKLRVCNVCYNSNMEDDPSHVRGDSAGKSGSEEEEPAYIQEKKEEKEAEEKEMQAYAPSSWLDSRKGTYSRLSIYDYPRSVYQ
ncbi:pleckstrin homology domain-containing family F member 2-like [Pholidichthys leucotaenia]